jgi:hypothetical protein
MVRGRALVNQPVQIGARFGGGDDVHG